MQSHVLALAFLLLHVADALPTSKYYLLQHPAASIDHRAGEPSHSLDPRASSRGRYGQKRTRRTIGFAVAFSIFGAIVLAAAIWWWVRHYRRRGIYSGAPNYDHGPKVAGNGSGNRWFGQSGITANPK